MKSTRFVPLTLLALLVPAERARAGPVYQALKACLKTCIATTPPLTTARLLCILDCYADYVDSKVSLNSLDLKVNVASTGYAFGRPPNTFQNAYLDLTGAANATVILDVQAGQPTPLRVDYILLNDANNPADPAFGTLIGSSNNAGSGFAFNFVPPSDGVIIAEAHFTTLPSEDIDQVAAIYFSTTPVAVPEPSAWVLGCAIGSLGLGLGWRGVRRGRQEAIDAS